MAGQILSTGFVVAAGYADKLRRTLFALTKGKVSSEEVVRAAAEINQYLFQKIVEEMKVDKLDVVRIRVPFEIKDGQIVWDKENVQIEVYKRAEHAQLAEAMAEAHKASEDLKKDIEELEAKLDELKEYYKKIKEGVPVDELPAVINRLGSAVDAMEKAVEMLKRIYA